VRLWGVWHRFSAFWLRSKCSICSYQLNIWYVPHRGTSILNWFLALGEDAGACSDFPTGWPGIAVPPGSAHSLRGVIFKWRAKLYKKVSRCRESERLRDFVSLNILLSYQRSFEITLLHRACVCPYYYFDNTMSVRRTVSEIFSVKEWRDLETGGRGRSRSLKMAPFDSSYTTFYWSAIVTVDVCCNIFKLFDVE